MALNAAGDSKQPQLTAQASSHATTTAAADARLSELIGAWASSHHTARLQR